MRPGEHYLFFMARLSKSMHGQSLLKAGIGRSYFIS
jgi:hypothetical protein